MRILYIDIDSLRPDHLGCYGYHRATSPAIDAIAADGVIFDHVHCSDAPCLPSRTALYSGRFGIHTGINGHGGTAAQPRLDGADRDFPDNRGSLADALANLGHHTAVISPFPHRHGAWHFLAGFSEFHHTGGWGNETADAIQPFAERWLNAHADDENWFLHLNFWDPHTPYRTPADYGAPFANDPPPAWLDDDAAIRRYQADTGLHSALDIDTNYTGQPRTQFQRQPHQVTNRDEYRRMMDGYDTAVRYVDDHLAKLVALLKARGIYDDTAIIISADHGENLGELGIFGNHATADEFATRIPLIVKWPGGARGIRNTRLHYHLDLAPTLTTLLGGRPHPLWDGVSFADTIVSDADTGRDELILTQAALTCQRSVRWGDWIYIRTYHDGYHLYPPEMLFNLRVDPREQHDLAADASHAAVIHEGAWRLERWHDAQMQKLAAAGEDMTDPLWTVIKEGGPFHARFGQECPVTGAPGSREKFEQYLHRLEATGRATAAGELRKKYL